MQLVIVVFLVCFTRGILAFPADNGRRVIITAPEYDSKHLVPEKVLFIPNNYEEHSNYYYGHRQHMPEHHEIIDLPSQHQHHSDQYHHHKTNKFSEEALRKLYNDFLNKKFATKKGILAALLDKTVDKTIELKAKLTQQLIDFISRVSIQTTANLAKHGIKATVHKIAEKKTPEYAYGKH